MCANAFSKERERLGLPAALDVFIFLFNKQMQYNNREKKNPANLRERLQTQPSNLFGSLRLHNQTLR